MAIVPGMTDLTRPYWEAARAGRLVVQRCGTCGAIRHPPLPSCPGCHGTAFGWREVSGGGSVYACTVVRHATHVALADQVPYVIAIVELAEGPRLVTAVTGCPPEDVSVGMPVRVRFRRVTEEIALPEFHPFRGDSRAARRPPTRLPDDNSKKRRGALRRRAVRHRHHAARRCRQRTEGLTDHAHAINAGYQDMRDGKNSRGVLVM
jgi:uncharacterized OB-fold protein